MKLGKKVRDTISGFTGIAVSKHDYINGCTRYTIQPPIDKDGKLPQTETFDDNTLEVLSEETITGNTTTGGPEKYLDRGMR